MTKRRLNVEMLDSDSANQALEIVGQLAESNGIKWALCGGIAMIVYGSPRLTKDVDIIASQRLPLPPDAVAESVPLLRRHSQSPPRGNPQRAGLRAPAPGIAQVVPPRRH